jgi:hypothetical protein
MLEDGRPVVDGPEASSMNVPSDTQWCLAGSASLFIKRLGG